MASVSKDLTWKMWNTKSNDNLQTILKFELFINLKM